MNEQDVWARSKCQRAPWRRWQPRLCSECYGVVGMASKTLRDGLAVLLQGSNPHRGIEVRFVDQQQHHHRLVRHRRVWHARFRSGAQHHEQRQVRRRAFSRAAGGAGQREHSGRTGQQRGLIGRHGTTDAGRVAQRSIGEDRTELRLMTRGGTGVASHPERRDDAEGGFPGRDGLDGGARRRDQRSSTSSRCRMATPAPICS